MLGPARPNMLQSTLTKPTGGLDAGVPHPIVDDEPVLGHISRPLRPNDTVGRYVIEGQLGRGGMGVVYRARDRALGRRVALKLVRSQLRPCPGQDQFTLRLRREARALASLSHPNVVGLYDLGTTGEAVFLAMAFVEGEHLAHTLSQGRWPWPGIVAMFEQAGRGLAAAHAAGIVHRDFKPTNVIVGPDQHVTVVDFGLACGMDREEASAAPTSKDLDCEEAVRLSNKVTDVNVVLGTRGYMAPEQLLGFPVGPAADQFAFCVSLYEALYGTLPYPGTNAVETARAFAAQALTEPEDRGEVPTHVHRTIVRGLSVNPLDRFESMDALLAALSPPRKRARHTGLAAVVVTTAAISAATTAWIGTQLTPAPAVAAAAITCDALVPAGTSIASDDG
ncbi:MAG: serine/threonine protein kinase [Nannocystaceae bacterium]|nr:serine/threonine protein kinase [Nannocystaceae bacterium]